MKKGQSNTSSVSASPTIVAPSSTINNNVSAATANNDALFDRKIDLITEGIDLFFASKLYIISQFFKNKKIFKELTRDEILQFLDSLRKPEASDPLHKWIGTYNLYRVLFIRFFKWLDYPDIEQKKRPKPSVIENIPILKRREQSIYKPSDLWTLEDDLLFLKYCPNTRDKCYHTISRDLSCRPHEILRLKLKDIHFKNSGDYQYAEVLLNGKTGSRNIPLISSIPYLPLSNRLMKEISLIET